MHYLAAPRPYPLVLPEMVYPDDMVVRWVKAQGDISWRGRHVYLSETLAGELVGLWQVTDDAGTSSSAISGWHNSTIPADP